MWIFVVNIYVLLKIGGPRRDVCLGVWFAGMVRGYGSGMVRRYRSEAWEDIICGQDSPPQLLTRSLNSDALPSLILCVQCSPLRFSVEALAIARTCANVWSNGRALYKSNHTLGGPNVPRIMYDSLVVWFGVNLRYRYVYLKITTAEPGSPTKLCSQFLPRTELRPPKVQKSYTKSSPHCERNTIWSYSRFLILRDMVPPL